MIEILPAIMPSSFKDLQEHIERLQGAAPRVQVDVVDGDYVYGKTWPYKDHASFATLVEEEHGLPQWDKIDYQFDLMVKHPEGVIKDYITVGATQLVLHAGAPGAQEALQQIVDRRDEMGVFSIAVGIALPAHGQLEDLASFEAQFDFVQVMGIDREGKQGEPFDKHYRAVYLLERLRQRYPLLPLQVDGGVTKELVPRLVQAGAQRLVCGSAIFKEDDPAAAYKELYTIANHAH